MSAPSIQLRRIAQVNPYTPGFDLLPDDAEVTFLPLEAVWPAGRADITRRATKADVSNGYTRFQCGDILLPKVSPTFQAGRVMVANIDTAFGAATTEVHVVRSAGEADARFLAYTLQSIPFLQEGSTTLQGVGNLRRVPPEFVREYPVLHVEPTEQRTIADFLDRETAQIDAMVDSQERLVALLEERRDSATLRAVTKGIRSDTTLSPSSETWIDSMPSHWSVAPINYYFEVTLGKMLDAGRAERPGEVTLPYLRAANIQDWGLELSSTKEMSFSTDERVRLDIRCGDLMVVEGGAIGTAVLIEKDMPGWSFQKTVNRVRSRGWASTAYLRHVIRTLRDRGIFDMSGNKSTIPHLTAEKLAATRVPVPPAEEQREIAAYVDDVASRINVMIAKAQESIALMKERRAALISAAVTGRIDVHTGVERLEHGLEGARA